MTTRAAAVLWREPGSPHLYHRPGSGGGEVMAARRRRQRRACVYSSDDYPAPAPSAAAADGAAATGPVTDGGGGVGPGPCGWTGAAGGTGAAVGLRRTVAAQEGQGSPGRGGWGPHRQLLLPVRQWMVAACDSSGPAGGSICAINHTNLMLVFNAYLYVFSACQQVFWN